MSMWKPRVSNCDSQQHVFQTNSCALSFLKKPSNQASMQQQQQQQDNYMEPAEDARSINQQLKEIYREMKYYCDAKDFGVEESKKFIEPTKTSEDGVAKAKTVKRKAIEEAKQGAQKVLETLIKFDKLVVRSQETTYEHSILSHKLKEQKRVETDIITLRRQKNISMQALRAEQGQLPRQERVEVEEDENHFGIEEDLT